MLVSLFRSNRPAVLLLLGVLVPALFLPGLWRTVLPEGPVMPLFALVVKPAGAWAWWPGLLTLVIVSLTAVQLTFLARDAELYEQRVHLPALLFPVLLALLAGDDALEPALLGLPLVVAAMARTWSIALAGGVLSRLFDAGLLLGIAALFFLPYAVLVLVVWASCSVIRPFHWREYVLPLLGTALPLYLAWAFLAYAEAGTWQPLGTVFLLAPRQEAVQMVPKALWWSSRIVLAGLLLVSLFVYAGGYQRGVMREKNLRASFMGFFFGMGVLALLLRFVDEMSPAALVVAPAALFLSHALLVKRRAWLGEVAMLLLLTAALWSRWA